MFFISHKEIENGEITLVEIEGPLNSESDSVFDDYIKKVIKSGTVFLLFDMKNLNFISSEGIGAALMIERRITAEKGKVVFCNLNNEVTALFRILGFNRIFTTANSLSEGINILKKRIGCTESGYEETPDKPEQISSEAEISGLDEPDISYDEPEIDELLQHKTIDPFIIECLKCGSFVRINEKGEHICPYCQAEFNVSDNGKALFRIDEIS